MGSLNRELKRPTMLRVKFALSLLLGTAALAQLPRTSTASAKQRAPTSTPVNARSRRPPMWFPRQLQPREAPPVPPPTTKAGITTTAAGTPAPGVANPTVATPAAAVSKARETPDGPGDF